MGEIEEFQEKVAQAEGQNAGIQDDMDLAEFKKYTETRVKGVENRIQDLMLIVQKQQSTLVVQSTSLQSLNLIINKQNKKLMVLKQEKML